VIGAIVPWNYPFEVLINKLGPILATGNTVVVKPARDTPWSATRIGRLIAERTDIPAGVVNIVTSSDHLVGERLTLDPRVDMISFTGSTATGMRIMEKGAATLKKVFLELGGKSAAIILDDADFASVVPAGISVCLHAGQGCAMQTRMLLPRSRYDEGVELLTAAMSNVPWGDPSDPSKLMGPLISGLQRDRVTALIRKGVEEGAKLVVGGADRPAGRDKGFFVEPTLFVDVDNTMTIAQDEIFGPVLAVIPYDDDEDAIRIANDSKYGLSGGIQSGNLERGLAMAHRIRTGSLNVNASTWYGADSPYGGYKTSGIGRQNGIEGFEQYTETKSISFPAE
jgi:aldehyde dehydrogenase (NAD+)